EAEGIITVTDNGSGIPPELMERIWEPFFTTKGDQGNGIGLDVSRRLIESHKGVITCRSEVNKGTTFEIRLPRFEFPAPTDEQPLVERSFEKPPAQAFVMQNG